MKVSISSLVAEACPGLRAGIIKASVVNSETSDALWDELQAEATRIATTYATDTLSKRPAIAGTRQAYKTFGKDPARYRVSSEALCRRAIRGLDLYRIDTLVDLINLVSLRTGYSIGGFDADKIVGRELCLGIGRSEEPFEGIGRGPLNIEYMPVVRDAEGGIGTPTSDHERTKMDINTSHILVIINGYSGVEGLQEAAAMTTELLQRYAAATDCRSWMF